MPGPQRPLITGWGLSNLIQKSIAHANNNNVVTCAKFYEYLHMPRQQFCRDMCNIFCLFSSSYLCNYQLLRGYPIRNTKFLVKHSPDHRFWMPWEPLIVWPLGHVRAILNMLFSNTFSGWYVPHSTRSTICEHKEFFFFTYLTKMHTPLDELLYKILVQYLGSISISFPVTYQTPHSNWYLSYQTVVTRDCFSIMLVSCQFSGSIRRRIFIIQISVPGNVVVL